MYMLMKRKKSSFSDGPNLQGGYKPDEDDISQMKKLEFYSSLIIKIDSETKKATSKKTLCICEAVNNQYHPKHKIAIVAVQNTDNRQAENDLPNKDVTNKELLTESLKAVTKERGAEGRASQSSPEINYQRRQ